MHCRLSLLSGAYSNGIAYTIAHRLHFTDAEIAPLPS